MARATAYTHTHRLFVFRCLPFPAFPPHNEHKDYYWDAIALTMSFQLFCYCFRASRSLTSLLRSTLIFLISTISLLLSQSFSLSLPLIVRLRWFIPILKVYLNEVVGVMIYFMLNPKKKKIKLEKRNIMFSVFGVLCLLDYVYLHSTFVPRPLAHSIPYIGAVQNKLTLWHKPFFIQCPGYHSIWVGLSRF